MKKFIAVILIIGCILLGLYLFITNCFLIDQHEWPYKTASVFMKPIYIIVDLIWASSLLVIAFVTYVICEIINDYGFKSHKN